MSLYVTDTHPLVWYASGQRRRLSRRVVRIFESADRNTALVYVPAMVLWEVSTLVGRGRVELRQPFDHWAQMLPRRGFEVVPVDLPLVLEARWLTFSRDPFDVSIVATAKLKDLPLITKDETIIDAGVVEVTW